MNSMRVTLHDNPVQFSAAVTAFLVEREVENCVLLGRISEALAAWPGTGRYASPPLMLSVESEGRIVAAGTMDFPHSLVLSEASADAVEAVVRRLDAAGVKPPGVTAPVPTARRFATAWCAASQCSSHLEVALRLFQLRRVDAPRAVGGAFRAAQERDTETLARWAEAFFRDVGDPRDQAYCAAEVGRRIEKARLFVWCDAEPVSMAGWAGRTPHGARVNFVYTPPDRRGRGYASACVAALSQHLLDSGRHFCCLFTDVANPTSNHIYQEIGYEPVGDFARHMFSEGDSSPR
jgi:predicted GNAT family acetyltransferase